MSTTDTPTQLDTLLRVPTAEAVDITLRPAGVIARSRAYLLDLVVRWAWLYISTTVMWLFFWHLENTFWLVSLFFVNLFITLWLYPVLFEVFWHGQTPGKRAFKLQVCADNGAPITWSASLLRNLLRVVDSLPLFYAVGIFVSLLHPQGKRLGDMMAGTLVLYADTDQRQTDWSVLAEIEPIKPPVALSSEEQQALLTFAERQRYLPSIRRQELATLGAHALYGTQLPQTDPLALLLGMAKFLLGDDSLQRRNRQ